MQTEHAPHIASEELANIVRAHALARKRWPEGMPVNAVDAADWWMARQEPARQEETPRKSSLPTKRGEDDKYRWITPYNERVIHTLRKFLTLPHPQQRIVLAASEDKIYWRGEDTNDRHVCFENRTMFENIIHETEIMRSIGVDSYRDQCMNRARKTIRNMANRK